MHRLEDIVVYQSVLDSISPEGKDRPSLLVEVAEFFREADYRPGILEEEPEETLTINLRAFDCYTFVEQCLAMALVFTEYRRTWDNYIGIVRQLRYREGIVDYASRLHYFCDWLDYHAQGGIIKDVTAALGGVPYRKHIHYMTSHEDLYPKLKDKEIKEKIRSVENALERKLGYYLPLPLKEETTLGIKHGDIIAFTTDTEGLDVCHVGIAVRDKEDQLYLLHASREAGRVIKSPSPLLDYLEKAKTISGIMVARPL